MVARKSAARLSHRHLALPGRADGQPEYALPTVLHRVLRELRTTRPALTRAAARARPDPDPNPNPNPSPNPTPNSNPSPSFNPSPDPNQARTPSRPTLTWRTASAASYRSA
eukprot:scaffold29274_cov63-Phaeocystis_antarctica.AAC.1